MIYCRWRGVKRGLVRIILKSISLTLTHHNHPLGGLRVTGLFRSSQSIVTEGRYGGRQSTVRHLSLGHELCSSTGKRLRIGIILVMISVHYKSIFVGHGDVLKIKLLQMKRRVKYILHWWECLSLWALLYISSLHLNKCTSNYWKDHPDTPQTMNRIRIIVIYFLSIFGRTTRKEDPEVMIRLILQ